MASEFLKELGVKMKGWRQVFKISQKKAASKIGISQSTWNKYETGKMIGGNAEVVERIRLLIGWR